MIEVTTPPSKGIRSRKRKQGTEEASLSLHAVSEKNLIETAPMILARGKTAAYKSGLAPRRLTEVIREMKAPMTPGTEDDFKPQKTNVNKGLRRVNRRVKWTSGRSGIRRNTRSLEASDVQSSREECDEENCSALVDGSGDHERIGESQKGA